MFDDEEFEDFDDLNNDHIRNLADDFVDTIVDDMKDFFIEKLKNYPVTRVDFITDPNISKEDKLDLLDSLIQKREEEEIFEDCSFLLNIKKDIESDKIINKIKEEKNSQLDFLGIWQVNQR